MGGCLQTSHLAPLMRGCQGLAIHPPPHIPKVRFPPTFPNRSVDVIVCASLSVFATEVWGGRRGAGDWNSRYYDCKNRARQRRGGRKKKKTKREEKIVSGIVQVWQEWSSVTLSVPQPHFFFFFVHPSTVSAQRLFDTHTHPSTGKTLTLPPWMAQHNHSPFFSPHQLSFTRYLFTPNCSLSKCYSHFFPSAFHCSVVFVEVQSTEKKITTLHHLCTRYFLFT